jgi:transposase-like protein
VGALQLLVPRDREGAFSTQLFARYQRNEKALVLALMEMYVEGVSTRKVAEITEALCGTSFGKSLVSALSGRLDGELAAWRGRRGGSGLRLPRARSGKVYVPHPICGRPTMSRQAVPHNA